MVVGPTVAGRRVCARRSSGRLSPRAPSVGSSRPAWALDLRLAVTTGCLRTTFPWGGSSPVGLPRPWCRATAEQPDCHPVLPLPPGFHPRPGPNHPPCLPDQMQTHGPPRLDQALVPAGSCRPEEPKPKRRRRSWPRERTASHTYDYAGCG